MKRWISAKIVLLLFFFSVNVFAQDNDTKDRFLSIRGSLMTEWNLLSSGNAVVFSPVGTTGTTYPAKDIIGPKDKKTSFWRNYLQLYLTHEYAEFWMKIYTNGDDFNWPDSVGLEATLLFPVSFLTDKLEIGFYHNSAHNLVEERYGQGIDVTGARLSFDFADVLRNGEWDLLLWGNYNFIADKTSPFVFTQEAQEMPRKDLDRLKWATGFRASKEIERCNLGLTTNFNASGAGLASMNNRFGVLYKIQDNIAVGPFAEYTLNLRRRDVFGRDEWQLGQVVEFQF